MDDLRAALEGSRELLATCAALGLDPATELERRRSAVAGRRGVRHSPDLGRIVALPRRDWTRGVGGAHGTNEELRAAFGAAYGLELAARLRPVQAAALSEYHDFGGALVFVRVGGGKTLVTLLAPLVRACSTILLVPASLREKTRRDWQRIRDGTSPMGRWRLPALWYRDERTQREHRLPGSLGTDAVLVLESYERVSRSGDEILARHRPEAIVADECHHLCHTDTALWRALVRYRRGRDGRVRLLGLSGTAAKRSLRDWAHLAEWALGPGSPLPRARGDLLEWAAVLDEGVTSRPSVGALARLVGPAHTDALLRDPVGVVRRAVGARVAATPGVLTARDDGPACSLLIRRRSVPIRAEGTTRALGQLRDAWELPDGQPVADAAQRWRHLRELALGFYYAWVTPPPGPWIDARRAWCAWARRVTARSRSGIDTEARAFRAAIARRRVAAAVAALAAAGRDARDLEWARDLLRRRWIEVGRPEKWLAGGEAVPRLTIVNARRAARVGPIDPALGHAAAARAWRAVRPIDSGGVAEGWDDVRASFTPETEARWLSEEVVKDAASWSTDGGLVWVEFGAVGDRLRELTGLSYYRKKCRNAAGGHVEDCPDAAAIVSLHSCDQGVNLQARFHRNYVTSPPRSGKKWEQFLGRTHRDGQRAHQVEADVVVAIPEHVEAFLAARGDAAFLEATLSAPQKLLYGDVVFDDVED